MCRCRMLVCNASLTSPHHHCRHAVTSASGAAAAAVHVTSIHNFTAFTLCLPARRTSAESTPPPEAGYTVARKAVHLLVTIINQSNSQSIDRFMKSERTKRVRRCGLMPTYQLLLSLLLNITNKNI